MKSLQITEKLDQISEITTLSLHPSQIGLVLTILKPSSFDLITNSQGCYFAEIHEK